MSKPARLGALTVGSTAFALMVIAAPASAHGVGTRGDLPLPVWQVIWGAAVAVVVSFAALGLLWVTPQLRAASRGRTLGVAGRVVDAIEWPARIVVLGGWALVTTAGLFGIDNPAVNIAPRAVFVIFWVGLPIASALFGGFWSRLNPFDTVAALLRRDGRQVHDAPAVGTVGMLGVISILAFLWLELAYHSPASPRVLGFAMLAYGVAMVAGALRNGREWLRANDGFVVLMSLIGTVAPLHRLDDGSLAVRAPFAGLSTVVPSRWLATFIVVVLGSTTFDGMEGVDFWIRIIGARQGWNFTLVSTIGLVWVIAAIAAAYQAASFVTARLTRRSQPEVADEFAASLVPIVLAYAVAHYFSLLMFDGQIFLIQASDPYGRGWDLFGTQNNSVDFLLVSTTTIAWVQVVSIVVGHIAGVVVAHDRAIERHTQAEAIRSQYPMLAVMVGYTVTGLLLLLNA